MRLAQNDLPEYIYMIIKNDIGYFVLENIGRKRYTYAINIFVLFLGLLVFFQ